MIGTLWATDHRFRSYGPYCIAVKTLADEDDIITDWTQRFLGAKSELRCQG